MQWTFRSSAISAALALAYGSALAYEEPELEELIKPDSTISVGIGNWSGDRHQQGIHDGMREGGAYGLIDANVVKRDDDTGTWLKLKIRDLGLDSREIRAEYLRQGNFGAFLEYNRTPYDNPLTYTTRLQGIGSTNQTVSTNAVPGPLRTLSLGTDRDRIDLGFYKNLRPGLDLRLSLRREEKTGTRAWGRGGQPEFAVEPIDSTTHQIEGTLDYTGERLQLSGGYYGSWYDNRNGLVSITHAGLPISNANTTYLSLPLDNQAHQLYLNGGYNFTPTTRGTFKLAYTRATQDERLPTYDIVGLSFAGAPSSLNGRVDTMLAQLGLSARPTRDLSLVAGLRYHDLDDRTPAVRIVEPAAGCTASTTCVDTTPFSYRTITGRLEASYRLTDSYRLTAGLDERRQDRTVPVANAFGPSGTDTQRVVPMRADVDETTARIELRRSLSATVNGSVGYLHSRRTGSRYVVASGPGDGTSPGVTGQVSNMINPINIADRDRNRLRLAVDWMPFENLSLQFNVEQARDDYDHDATRPYGLREGNARLYSLDAAYTLNEKWQVNAWYSYDRSRARQLALRAGTTGATATASGNKDFDLEDTGNAFGFGLRGEVSSRLKLGADLQWLRNVGRYGQDIEWLSPGSTYAANVSEGLADIENRLLRLGAFVVYAIDKQSDLRFDVIHERWKTNDWSWLFASGNAFTYGTTTDGTVVSAHPKQTANFVGVRYVFKFQ